MSEWISVEDELPKEGKHVITLDKIGRELETQLFYYGDENRPEFKVVGFVWEHSNVTHWKSDIRTNKGY